MVIGQSDQPSPARPPTLPRNDTRTLGTDIFAMNPVRTFLPLALFLAGIINLPGEIAPPKLGPAAMDSYQQTVWVTFRGEAAARRAQVHIAPLYHDLQVAFSTRMDDSNLNDVRVAEVMARFGQKGTFFLCDPGSWWQDSTTTGVKVSGDPGVEVPRILLAGGNSIGGHTLNHEMLPALSRNSAFGEILGARVALEVRTAAPNIAFVYPYVVFKSELQDGVDRADLEEMLRRSGYYQLAEHRYNEEWDSGLQDGVFIVLDGSTADGRYDESGLTQGRTPKDRPLFLVTMHAWVKEWGGADYPKLAEIYRRWSGRKDWWYCNLNEYGSYRYQAAHSRLATFARGNVVKVVLQRPDPLDLGDQTPLTLRIEGTSREDIVSVACADAEAKPVSLEGAYAFDLFHDRGRGAIEACAATDNPENSDRLDEAKGGVEGLRALLYRRDQVLTLALRNEGTQPLRDLRVVFRLPLRWQEGVVRKQLSLDAGASAHLQVSLTEQPRWIWSVGGARACMPFAGSGARNRRRSSRATAFGCWVRWQATWLTSIRRRLRNPGWRVRPPPQATPSLGVGALPGKPCRNPGPPSSIPISFQRAAGPALPQPIPGTPRSTFRMREPITCCTVGSSPPTIAPSGPCFAASMSKAFP